MLWRSKCAMLESKVDKGELLATICFVFCYLFTLVNIYISKVFVSD